MKSMYVLLFIVVLQLLLVGCKPKISPDDVDVIVKVNNNATDTKISVSTTALSEYECHFPSDCPDGLYCLSGGCTTIDDFYVDHVGCCEEGMLVGGTRECDLIDNLTQKIENCSMIRCESCVIGAQSCVRSGTDVHVSYCAECLNRFDCKPDYNCVRGACVHN